MMRATTTLADPCTGARRRDFLLGLRHGQLVRAHVPSWCSGHGVDAGCSQRAGPPGELTTRSYQTPAEGTGTLSWTSAIWAGTGVVLGCTASYALGRAIGPRFHESRFASRRREPILRAERLFDRFGAVALFAAYFSGPLRGAAPFAAGLPHLSFLRFQAVNVASAMVWIAVGMSPGAIL